MITPERASARSISLGDAEPVVVSGGALQWIPVRRRLGIKAFGTNAYRAERAGDIVIEEHVESPGQEELYVVLAGRARIVVDGTLVLAIGGWPDRAYHSLPWEPIYLAQEQMLGGDWAAAAETLEREAGDHRDTAIVKYRLACCHARAGDADRAMSELRGAVAATPAFAEKAATEEHLASLRDLEGWSELVN